MIYTPWPVWISSEISLLSYLQSFSELWFFFSYGQFSNRKWVICSLTFRSIYTSLKKQFNIWHAANYTCLKCNWYVLNYVNNHEIIASVKKLTSISSKKLVCTPLWSSCTIPPTPLPDHHWPAFCLWISKNFIYQWNCIIHAYSQCGFLYSAHSEVPPRHCVYQ